MVRGPRYMNLVEKSWEKSDREFERKKATDKKKHLDREIFAFRSVLNILG